MRLYLYIYIYLYLWTILGVYMGRKLNVYRYMVFVRIVNMVIVQSMWVMLGLYRSHIMKNHLQKDNGKSNGNWGQLLGT